MWSIVFLEPLMYIAFPPEFSRIRFFTYWFEPVIWIALTVAPASLDYLKSILGYSPFDCFMPTNPPGFEPVNWILSLVFILINGVLI